MFCYNKEEPKRAECHVSYQIKARFVLYRYIVISEMSFVDKTKFEIETAFFTFIVCANTLHVICNP